MKNLLTTLLIIALVTLCGCEITQAGSTLYSFTEKMNSLDDNYNLTEADYIYDLSDKSATKFYVIDSRTYTLTLDFDDENRIKALHIVFDNSEEDNPKGMKFIKNCICAYTENEKAARKTEEILLKNKNKPSYESITEKFGNTDLIIDVTDIGTIVSVVQNNP